MPEEGAVVVNPEAKYCCSIVFVDQSLTWIISPMITAYFKDVCTEVKIYLCLYGYMEFIQRVLVALPQRSTPHTPRISTFFAQLFLIIQKC
ncbi:hypothetical protein T06_4776 [Trichinella sp. T6]|nr:hypothetical protein T06_4776 [Trichinella sp. T6]